MPTYTAGNLGVGAVTTSIWDLDTVSAGIFAKVVSIAWGGQSTTSTGKRDRWIRPTTAGSGVNTAITSGYHQPNFATVTSKVCVYTGTPAAVTPTDPNGALFAVSWNSQGGVGILIHPLANPWWVVNGVLTGQINCRAISGGDSTSSYEVTVEE
jgi:hypothetical protein